MVLRALDLDSLDTISGGDALTDFTQRDRFNRAYHGLPGAFGDAPYFPNGGNFFDRRDITPRDAEGLRALADGPGGGEPNPLHPQSIEGIRGMLDAYEKGQRGEPDPLWPDGGSETLPEIWQRMPPQQPETTRVGELDAEPSPYAVAQADVGSDSGSESYGSNDEEYAPSGGDTELA
ncbi:MAG: hypothetical protein U0235_03350 [Polyangiaceae bacterium]